jgi:hypothetical protein
MLPPQRSSKSRACLRTSAVFSLRNALGPSGRHRRLRISPQQFDQMTPELNINQDSRERNLTRGSRRAWIAFSPVPKRREAGRLMTACLVQAPEYSANKKAATQLDGDKHQRPKRRYRPAHQEHDGSL